MKVTGTFSVTMKPLQPYSSHTEGTILGRMSIDKEFKGALTATSQGEMLTGMTALKTSAGYVAIEKVTGSVDGKEGTFVLQHFGIMAGNESRLMLEVIPDSGTGALTGISGEMEIINESGQHSYVFDYSIP
ncbi:MAG: DUF3224 domain-containing protein [Lewinella sp.]